jgi:hypothetical protein
MGIMKRVRMMAFAAVLVAARARAQPSALGCAAEGDHERWALKTRWKPRSLTSAKAVSLPTILAWAIPADHGAGETAARRPREPRLYTVSAFVRKIKLSDDDCDLHLELAGSGAPGAPRVIVEIPAAQAAWQKKASGMFNLSKDVQSHVYNGDKPKPITVTGYAFLDLSHQCAAFPTGRLPAWRRPRADAVGDSPGADARGSRS